MNDVFDLLIIGGGPAGLTAGIYGAQAGLSTAILERLSPGGQMTLTGDIENYPGIPAISGWELGMRMKAAAEAAGAQVFSCHVSRLALAARPIAAFSQGKTFLGRSLILATGAQPRRLGLGGEAAFIGRGVHYCAHCDGGFYRGKTAAVVGGGYTALQDALYLADLCRDVHLIHRRDTFRAGPELIRKVKNHSRITLHTPCTVSRLLGENHFSGVVLSGPHGERKLPCDGLFVAIGTVPATSLVERQLRLTEDGSILANESTCTELPGVFAAGDVRCKSLRQIVTAVSDGAVAAAAAIQYLKTACPPF